MRQVSGLSANSAAYVVRPTLAIAVPEFFSVRTLVAAEHRAWIEEAVGRARSNVAEIACSLARSQAKRNTAASVDLHADDLRALYDCYPYAQRTCLIVAVAKGCKLWQSGGKDDLTQTLPQVLASWDAVVLLCEEQIDDRLQSAVGAIGGGAARLGMVHRDAASVALLALELCRLREVAMAFPAARFGLPSSIYRRLSTLPTGWQRVVLEALCYSTSCDVAWMARECGVDRRTLQRTFRRVGLPSPGELLRMVVIAAAAVPQQAEFAATHALRPTRHQAGLETVSLEMEHAVFVLSQLLSRSVLKRRIVRLLVEGEQRKRIATALNRSIHTVDSHVKQLYRETGLRNRVSLCRAALECVSLPTIGELSEHRSE